MAEHYKVEKNVPIPNRTTISKLEVGESMLIPLERRSSIQSQATILKKTHGKEFTIKKIDESSVRVWRTQ